MKYDEKVVAIVNNLAAEDGSLDFNLKCALDIVSAYGVDNDYEMRNGCLFINGKICKRLSPLNRSHLSMSEEEYYYAGACIKDY